MAAKFARTSFCFFRSVCTYKNIVIEEKGPIRIVSINRPESRNCVDSATANELYDAFLKLDTDSSVSVGILAGKGGTFCAGYDLKKLSKTEESSISFEQFMPNSKGPMVLQ